MQPLNILHVFRAPVGGLFRHVLDLTRGQIARGHRVGLIADSHTGGENAEKVLRELAPSLALGFSRFPMRRHANPGDLFALAHVLRRVAQTGADIVHGHGAKGGAFARLTFGRNRAVRAYTPHGGSLLFGHDTLAGKFYLMSERLLMLRGDLFLFESAYSADIFRRKIGNPPGLVRIVHNGVSRAEFEPIVARGDATDLVFMGELRSVKGIDVLIEAIALLRRDGRSVTATLVGSGPDRDALGAQVERLGLSADVRFKPAMPGYEALTLGRIMVVPSRAESLPYVVLEAAAGGKPLITTRVGGIPEIYGPLSDALVLPQDAPALARAIAAALDNPAATIETARLLRERVAASFSVDTMVDGVLAGYQAALEKLRADGGR
ncbi:MAG TPA: glycosyltransferase family 4 protein [Burkholderiales bacterium]|nr:glycosyltransferase family 4 protein [Burkholderiales bacterium]